MMSLSFLFSCTFPAKPWQIPTEQTGPSTYLLHKEFADQATQTGAGKSLGRTVDHVEV